MADVLANEIVPGHRDQVPREITEAMQQTPIRNATVVLPVPGLPVKLMCRRRELGDEAEPLAGLVHQQQRRQLTEPS